MFLLELTFTVYFVIKFRCQSLSHQQKGKTKANAMPVTLQVKLRRCQSAQLARMIDWFTHAGYDNSMHSWCATVRADKIAMI